MKLLLLIFVGFLFLVESQNCIASNQTFFEGACIKQYCFTKAQQQGNFQTVDFTNATLLKQLNGRMTAQVMTMGKGQWLVDFQFGDRQFFNRLFYENGVDCVDFRVYLNSNEYTVDPSRLLVREEGSIPSWPQSFYQWNTRFKIGEVFFYLNETYFQDNKQCLQFNSWNKTTFDCYFELAIILRHKTVYSYYASIRFEKPINQNSSNNSDSTLRLTRLLKIPQCINSNQYNCSISNLVNSTVVFCDNKTCSNTSITPFSILQKNQLFYIKHMVSDSTYMNEYIFEPQMVFQSLGLFVFYDSSYFKVITKAQGYSIYGLTVPMSGKQVYLTSKGNLTLNSNQTQSLDEQYNIVNFRILLGEVTYSIIIVSLNIMMISLLLF